MATVYLVDDFPIFAVGLRSLLSADGFEVTNGIESALKCTSAPTVLLLSPPAVSGDGWSRISANLPSGTPLLLIERGTYPVPESAWSPARLAGVVRRTSPPLTILAKVRSLTESFQEPGSDPGPRTASTLNEVAVDLLSPRERQVLDHIANGRTHQQIARQLSISHHTVETYIKRLRFKLTVGNKADLARIAVLARIAGPQV